MTHLRFFLARFLRLQRQLRRRRKRMLRLLSVTLAKK
jgi:hypothetical protein